MALQSLVKNVVSQFFGLWFCNLRLSLDSDQRGRGRGVRGNRGRGRGGGRGREFDRHSGTLP